VNGDLMSARARVLHRCSIKVHKTCATAGTKSNSERCCKGLCTWRETKGCRTEWHHPG